MAAMNLQDLDDNLARKGHYVYSDDDAFTLKLHASRSAARQAAFFLPYLLPGMSLLDCGSGSGSITVGLAQRVAPGQVTGIEISEAEVARAPGARRRQKALPMSSSRLATSTNLLFPLNPSMQSFPIMSSNTSVGQSKLYGRCTAY